MQALALLLDDLSALLCHSGCWCAYACCDAGRWEIASAELEADAASPAVVGQGRNGLVEAALWRGAAVALKRLLPPPVADADADRHHMHDKPECRNDPGHASGHNLRRPASRSGSPGDSDCESESDSESTGGAEFFNSQKPSANQVGPLGLELARHVRRALNCKRPPPSADGGRGSRSLSGAVTPLHSYGASRPQLTIRIGSSSAGNLIKLDTTGNSTGALQILVGPVSASDRESALGPASVSSSAQSLRPGARVRDAQANPLIAAGYSSAASPAAYASLDASTTVTEPPSGASSRRGSRAADRGSLAAAVAQRMGIGSDPGSSAATDGRFGSSSSLKLPAIPIPDAAAAAAAAADRRRRPRRAGCCADAEALLRWPARALRCMHARLQFGAEARALMRLRHPHLLRLLGVLLVTVEVEGPSSGPEHARAHQTAAARGVAGIAGAGPDGRGLLCEPVLVLEHAPNGSLRELLTGPVELDDDVALRILRDAARGLAALHASAAPPRLHGSLSADAVLIGPDLEGLVGGFGFAAAREAAGGLLGEPASLAPEVLRGGPPTPAADVYSFGMIIHEVLARGAPPFAGEDLLQALSEVAAGPGLAAPAGPGALHGGAGPRAPRRPALPARARAAPGGPFLAELLRRCTEEEPALRPTFREIAMELEGRCRIICEVGADAAGSSPGDVDAAAGGPGPGERRGGSARRAAVAARLRGPGARLPPRLAGQLAAGRAAPPEPHADAALVYCTLDGFDALAASLPEGALADLLGRLHGRWDELLRAHGLWGIETAGAEAGGAAGGAAAGGRPSALRGGGAYLAAGGVPEPQAFYAARAAEFALAAVAAAAAEPILAGAPEQGCARARAGVACGPLTAAVVGAAALGSGRAAAAPRYVIVGEAVTLVSRMEALSQPGRVCLSAGAAAQLRLQSPHLCANLQSRGWMPVPGRGEMELHWLLPSPLHGHEDGATPGDSSSSSKGSRRGSLKQTLLLELLRPSGEDERWHGGRGSRRGSGSGSGSGSGGSTRGGTAGAPHERERPVVSHRPNAPRRGQHSATSLVLTPTGQAWLGGARPQAPLPLAMAPWPAQRLPALALAPALRPLPGRVIPEPAAAVRMLPVASMAELPQASGEHLVV